MNILLVDDDNEFAATLLPILSQVPGAVVRAANNGGTALQGAVALGEVHLLLSDVVMEPMNGFALRDQILRRHPKAHVIFMSGFDLSDYTEQVQHSTVLQKPFSAEELLSAIEREFTPLPVVRPPAPPVAVAAGVTVVKPPPVPSAERVEDTILGTSLGAYHILSELGVGRWGKVYAAIQISINREVALKILDLELSLDPTQKERFIADARAKAHVQHPSILSVYEAGEFEGRTFYAHEYVDGASLAELAAGKRVIDEASTLKVLRAAGDGLAYLFTHKVAHSALQASHVFLSNSGQVRLGNIATHLDESPATPEEEIRALGRIMLPVVGSVQALSPGLRNLLSRMVQSGPTALNNWGQLLQGVKALEPKIVPVEAAKMSAQDRAAIEAVSAARKAQDSSLKRTVGSILFTLVAVGWLVWFQLFRSNERNLDAQVEVPAGDYLVGDGEKVHVDGFWIDKYEVTIGQYAKFLDFLAKNPTAESDFNHDRQPRQLDHQPKDWNIYFLNAKAGTPVHGVPTSLNSPMLMVTWWDAFAYAKWLGRELPTEQEWEAAARGPKGLPYPWGTEFEPKKVNANGDYNPRNPAAPGKVDGFNFWSDVDAISADRSPLGVIGMAGNVSEWVAWDKKLSSPVYKGGNFTSSDVRLDKRVSDHAANKGEEFLGFRTISRTPPSKK